MPITINIPNYALNKASWREVQMVSRVKNLREHKPIALWDTYFARYYIIAYKKVLK